MRELADIFPGATQTSQTITIPKASLPSLTAQAANGGDAIVAGVLLALRDFYQARLVGGDAPLVVEPLLPFWDYWTDPPSQVWALSVILRQQGAAPPFRADGVGVQTFGADPALLGRGGGAIALGFQSTIPQRGRGGGSVAAGLVAAAPAISRGGGVDRLMLPAGGDEFRWLVALEPTPTNDLWVWLQSDSSGAIAAILLSEV